MLNRLTRDWEGETVFVVAGGPSVSQHDVDRLRGRRVVAVNSSYEKTPWADALVFTDLRWWRQHQSRVRATFQGQVVTVVPPKNDLYDGLLVLSRQRSSGISTDPTRLAWWHTSMTTALNMVALRGATRIGVLGLDGKGGWHHEPHPELWGSHPRRYHFHGVALEAQVAPLRAFGVEVFNLNQNSTHKMFSFSTLDQML